TESGVDGVNIFLYQNAQFFGSTVTAKGGFYRFDHLPPGKQYSLLLGHRDGYFLTDADRGPDDEADSDLDPQTARTTTFMLSDDQVNLSVDAGLMAAASVTGSLWSDRNANGTRDSGEEGLAYWTVYLDADGDDHLDPGEAYTWSDRTGAYTFTS